MNEDLGIDFDIDFFDQGHMNPAGMRIMTKELGKLLQGMGMADQRQDSSAAEWQKNYEAFIDYRAKRLKSIDQAKIYLMSLQDPDFVSIIQVKRGMLEDVQTAKLIERLKDGENQVIVVDDKDVLPDPDSKEENYDLYCVVYKKTDLNTPVDSGGFVQEKSFSRKN